MTFGGPFPTQTIQWFCGSVDSMQVTAEDGGRKIWSCLSNFAGPTWQSWSLPIICWYLHLTISQLHILIFDLTYLTEHNAGSFLISTIPPLTSNYSRLAQDSAIHLFSTGVFHPSSSDWISLALWSIHGSVALQASTNRAVDNWIRTVRTIPARLHYTSQIYTLIYLLHSEEMKAKRKP